MENFLQQKQAEEERQKKEQNGQRARARPQKLTRLQLKAQIGDYCSAFKYYSDKFSAELKNEQTKQVYWPFSRNYSK